jgi:hypothetical protein
MIINAEQQKAEEMARRVRMKVTRQGLVDNDAILPAFKSVRNLLILINSLISFLFLYLKKEQPTNEDKDNEHKESKIKTENNTTSKPITKTKKPITSTTGQKTVVKLKPKVEISTSNKDTTSSHGRHTFDINCSICANPAGSKSTSPKPSTPIPTGNSLNILKILIYLSGIVFFLLILETIPQPLVSLPNKPSDEPRKLPSTSPIREESNPTFPSVDLDNDYIEPESPTGIDALLYDDDDDLNNMSTHSRQSSIQQQLSHPESPGDNHEYLPPTQPTIRGDYNPLAASKPKIDPAST